MSARFLLDKGCTLRQECESLYLIRRAPQDFLELSLFDFDLVKRINSATISRTSSVSLGDRVADEEALGEALSFASDRQEYSRFKASWLHKGNSSFRRLERFSRDPDIL